MGRRPTFNLADLFETVVDSVPDRTALTVHGRSRLTYRELDERANQLAHHLLALDVGRGQHVGLMIADAGAYLEAMLGCFKAGAVPVNINHRYVAAELLHLVDDADIVALLHDAGTARRVQAVSGQAQHLRHVIDPDAYGKAVAAASPERPAVKRSGDDIYVLYTGGTTGMPKGVLWRHEDVFYGAMGGGDRMHTGDAVSSPEELADRAAAAQPGVTLVAAPMMHGNAQWTTFGTLFAGSTVVVLPDGRFDGQAAVDAVDAEGINVVSLVGDAMATPLADALADRAAAGAPPPPTLVAVASGGAVLSPVNKRRLADLLPGALVVDGVGSSEAGVVGTRSSARDDAGQATQPGFVVDQHTAVFDADDRPVVPGSDVVGQIARSGHIPLGYYNDPEKSAATFRRIDGVRWSFTGDAAKVAADGRVELLGRGSTSINTGGEKVFPEEVEAALKAHPAVLDAVVVGLPDERWGERVVAVVQPRPGTSPSLDELQQVCRLHLASYKVPRSLCLVDEVRRSPAGKADYPWAREVAGAR